jgi:hypothetical protein
VNHCRSSIEQKEFLVLWFTCSDEWLKYCHYGNDDNGKADREYQIYLDERKSLIETIRDSVHQLDKSILTLSAGALAISITFLKDIAPMPIKESLRNLYWAWGLFTVSMLSTLLSFFASQKACRKQIEILEDIYIDKKEGNEKNIWAIITNAFNCISITLFILGTIFLISFTIQNLERAIEAREKEKETLMMEKKVEVQSSQKDGGMVPAKSPKRPPAKNK